MTDPTSLREGARLVIDRARERASSPSILGEPFIDFTALVRDTSRDCSSPIWNEWAGGYVRCRKCPECARAKRRQWIARCYRESELCERVWFVTLTFRDASTASYKAVQRFLKRTRYGYTGRLRYLATEERGSLNGRYHIHMLVFCDASLTWRGLDKWTDGHWKANLVTDKPGRTFGYVAKYLTKQTGRVRASLAFGGPKGGARCSAPGSGGTLTPPIPLTPVASHFQNKDERDGWRPEGGDGDVAQPLPPPPSTGT